MSKNFDVSAENQLNKYWEVKRIKNIRERTSTKQNRFSKKIGISSQFLGLVEEGKSNLTYRSIKLLRDISGHTTDYILFGLDDNILNTTRIFLQKYDEKELMWALDMLKELAFVLNRK